MSFLGLLSCCERWGRGRGKAKGEEGKVPIKYGKSGGKIRFGGKIK